MNFFKNYKVIFWKKLTTFEQKKILSRPQTKKLSKIKDIVEEILNEVKKNGDSALKLFSKKFDHIELKNFKIHKNKIKNSNINLSKTIKTAINIAISNITKFHKMQNLSDINLQTSPGIYCQQIIRPLNIVGLYVPGGTAPLLSTAMMLGIPANLAKCKRIILCSPPPISNEILYVSKLCGIKEIYQIGGCQAIAAMGFGTKSIPKVDKIFGPGNIWVTEAKRQISYRMDGTSIDMLAGPSEVLIIADDTANPKFIAADLLSQAEHGTDSHVLLITPKIKIAKEVIKELNRIINMFSRKSIIYKSLNNSVIIITENLKDCFSISNNYSPEHLIINTNNAIKYVDHIKNAGSIFLGHWSPESAGDYATGPNHILPTYGRALSTSSLSVTDFQKKISIQKLTKNGLLKISSTIQTLANIEQLEAHKYAITCRINNIKEKNEYPPFSSK